MVVYRESRLEDAGYLAGLHNRYIPWGFLSSLGVNVLRWIYHSLAVYPAGVVIVAEDDGRIVGFVSGVLGVKEYYVFFLRKYFCRVAPYLFSKIAFIRKMAETMLYAGRKDYAGSIPKGELLAIVVNKDYRGRRIAQGLFNKQRKWFDERGVHRFKTTVGEANSRSIKFFRGLGCKESGKEEIHRGQRSTIFVWDGNET